MLYIPLVAYIVACSVRKKKKRKSGHNSHKNEKDHVTKIDSPFFWFGGGLAWETEKKQKYSRMTRT